MAIKFGELFGELRVDDSRFDRDVKAAGDRAEDTLADAGKAGGDKFAKSAEREVDAGGSRVVSSAEQVGDKAGGGLASRMESGASGMKEGLSGVMDGVGIPLEMGAAGVGVAAGAALAAGLMNAMEQEAIGDKLAARLNLDPTQAKNAGAVAGHLWLSGFGESQQDVADALDAVISTLPEAQGANAAALDDLTTRALTFADVMGYDVQDATMTASVMIRNGLFANGTEAFDALTVASQRMPAAMREELFPLLDEYSTYLTTLGMDGPQQLAFLANASKGGAIEADKAADSMKELGIRVTDLGDTNAQNALGMLGLKGRDVANAFLEGGPAADMMREKLLGALTAVKDPADQATIAVALFGTPIEDMNKAKIPEFLTSLQSMQGGLGDTAGAVDGLGGAYNNNAATVEQWKRDVGQKITDMMANVIENFPKGLQAIQGWAAGVRDTIRDALNWVIDHWNDLSLTLPTVSTPFGDVGGWTLDTPNVPRFHTGGTLGGRMGQEQLFLGLGGETIRTVQQEQQLQQALRGLGGGGTTYGGDSSTSVQVNMQSNANPQQVARQVAWSLKTAGV